MDRLPLVYATRAALSDAERLLPGRVLPASSSR